MAKVIPGDTFIPANRENPALRMSAATRSNPSRCMRVRHHAGAVKSLYGTSERADFEFLKNTVNIDKFLKMFEGQTNDIFYIKLAKYQDILK